MDAADRLHERNFAPPKARLGDVVRERILPRAAANTAPDRGDRRSAGCGKTTFAAQDCALDVRPTARVNLRDLDNDPFRLLDRASSARWVRSKFAIHDSVRVSRRRAQCKERQSCYWDCYRQALTGAPPVQTRLGRCPRSARISFDRGSAISRRRVADAVAPRPRFPRVEPDVALARLRVVHDLTEVHFADLALHEHETAEVLDRAGAHWQESAVEELHSRTEGWVTGVALATMASSEAGRSTAPIELSGKAHEVADYFFDEVLRQQPSVLREFMLSTSVLHRFSAPLCDAMMNRSDSARASSPSWSGTTLLSCRWTGNGPGIATITCSKRCCEPSSIGSIRRCRRTFWLEPQTGTNSTVRPMKRSSTGTSSAI